MDKVTVSGAVDTGSIPVRDAIGNPGTFQRLRGFSYPDVLFNASILLTTPSQIVNFNLLFVMIAIGHSFDR